MIKKYPLIVSDFDETLRNDEGTISPENAEAIRKYIAAGGIFAICTGRMMTSILPHAESLRLDSLLVGYQGALILDLKSGKYLRDEHMSVKEAVRVCRTLEKTGLHIHVYDRDKFYVNADDGLLAAYERICKVKGKIVTSGMADFVVQNGIQPQKILAMVEPEQKAAVFEKTAQLLGEDFYVTTSAGALVEITKKGCDKGSAVRFLADYYRVPIEDVIAIGDNINDIPMIEAAGLGVAVGNAVQPLKDAADEATLTNNQNAVAHIIEKYGMGENP